MREVELTVLMPCLNEAETLKTCITKAQKAIAEMGIEGEVLIADNGSTDGSIEIAESCGARVEHVPSRGYGAALIGGISAAAGKYCIMGDADDSYDFSKLDQFVKKLREGYDLVMGNRFKGGIEKGAMPFLHRYLGTPVISFLGRLFYHNDIGDFNCGMRGFNTESMRKLGLRTTGMEFASEMIVQSALHGYKIAEVPCTLSVDGRSRKPYLSTWSDGWRHLKFLLMHSPDWLFLYPGVFLSVLGLVLMVSLLLGPIHLSGVSLDINTLLFASAFLIIGMNLISFSIFTKVYASVSGYIPMTKSMERLKNFQTDKGVFIGVLLFLAGVIVSIVAIVIWGRAGFGALEPGVVMRITIPAVALCILGVQLAFGSFMVSILQIKHQ
ncbi:MAG: glycosyltransferase family 2 protein [Lachnospiraceae bacterium]|nr:glycosyltransferase family 2 protein [Lachnospiraceae bacterium]